MPVACHAPVFPLSPDASDMSSLVDAHKHSWESLPVSIKTSTQVESAGPLNLTSETPTVFHGRGLRRSAETGCRFHCGFVKRPLVRGMLGGSGGAHSSFAPACLLVVWLVAGVLVETLRELATRGKSTSPSGKSSGEGAGARVAVRSVLEDHETAILDEKRLRDCEPSVAVVTQLETRVEEMEQLEVQLVQLWGLAKLTELVVARSFKDESRTWSSGAMTLPRVSTLVSTLSRVASGIWSMIGEGRAPDQGRDTNTWRCRAGDLLSLGPSSSVSLWWLSEEFLVQVFARVVRTSKYGALFPYGLVSGSHVFGVWVLHVSTENWIPREML